MFALLSRIDHLVLATPDVESTSERLEESIGVRAVAGGSHAAWGTRNALIGFGDSTYLEIIGPDPEHAPEIARPFGLDQISEPRLVTWAANASDLERFVSKARSGGIDLGDVQRRSRIRPDGIELNWKMTDLSLAHQGGIVPFFIEWGDAPHPATTSVQGGKLLQLRAAHPQAEEVRAILQALGLELPVESGPVPKLMATIRTLGGSTIEIA